MQPAPPCACSMRVSRLLLSWELPLGSLSVGLFIYLSSQLCCPLRFQNSPQTCQWEGFLVFGNFSSFMTPSPRWVSVPNSFVSLFTFYILSYFLSKTTGCLSGCLVSSGQRSEVVLWNLLSIQMFFQWVCVGESGLPVLFLHHPRTAPLCNNVFIVFDFYKILFGISKG